MKSRAPLALMEQMVMLLVFAVAAALCMQAFVKSDEISLKNRAKSGASLAAQNIAETIRHSGKSPQSAFEEAADRLGGNYESTADKVCGRVTFFYDEDWNAGEESYAYFLTVEQVPDSGKGVWKALIRTFAAPDMSGGQEPSDFADGKEEPELLTELEFSWMKEGTYEERG